MTDSPSVTCPSPAMTTLSLRRTQRTVVDRMRRGAGFSAALFVAAATVSIYLFMSAIVYYTVLRTKNLVVCGRYEFPEEPTHALFPGTKNARCVRFAVRVFACRAS